MQQKSQEFLKIYYESATKNRGKIANRIKKDAAEKYFKPQNIIKKITKKLLQITTKP